jgi:hypothetical protein
LEELSREELIALVLQLRETNVARWRSRCGGLSGGLAQQRQLLDADLQR